MMISQDYGTNMSGPHPKGLPDKQNMPFLARALTSLNR